jgi:mannose-6-phosphate isomerase-like protein (cupin superfamily)
MAEVATKKLFENDRVIVWELTLEPGESSGLHTHKHEYFFQVLSGSTLETLDSTGISLGEFDFETGSTHYLTLDGDELVYGDIRVPATHDARNVGGERYNEILVELK